MDISTELVKELRGRTGAGIMECRNVLIQAKGDMNMAVTILKEKSLKDAGKRAGRSADNGKVGAYIHGGGKIGVLVEINCETDFVAGTDEFNNLVKEVAMQVAAYSPAYLNKEDVPAEAAACQKKLYETQAKEEGKPEKVIGKIAEGKLQKFYSAVCLLEQPYIRDESLKVSDLVKEAIAKTGENIVVKRFARFSLGGKFEAQVQV